MNFVNDRRRFAITWQQVLVFNVFFLFYCAIFIPLAFDYFLPGDLFSLPLIVIIPVALILLSVFSGWACCKLKQKVPAGWGHSRKGRVTVLLLLAVILLFSSLTLAGISSYPLASAAMQTADAGMHEGNFKVIIRGDISEKLVTDTVMELEQGVNSFRTKYNVHYADRHKLYLYCDADTMQRETMVSSEVLGFVRFEDGQPAIYLPVKQRSNPLLEMGDGSTLRHEALHIVFAELLGEEKTYGIPCWFHEGMACCESLDHAASSLHRTGLRYELYRNAATVTPADILLDGNPPLEKVDHNFYLTAYELTRYILQRRGEELPRYLIWNVINGISFERALEACCGAGPRDIYEEWYGRFF